MFCMQCNFPLLINPYLGKSTRGFGFHLDHYKLLLYTLKLLLLLFSETPLIINCDQVQASTLSHVLVANNTLILRKDPHHS